MPGWVKDMRPTTMTLNNGLRYHLVNRERGLVVCSTALCWELPSSRLVLSFVGVAMSPQHTEDTSDGEEVMASRLQAAGPSRIYTECTELLSASMLAIRPSPAGNNTRRIWPLSPAPTAYPQRRCQTAVGVPKVGARMRLGGLAAMSRSCRDGGGR